MRRRTAFMFLLIALLAVGVYWIDIGWGGKITKLNIGGYQNDLSLKQGLDLQGGIQIIMQAKCPSDQPKCDIAGSMPAIIQNLQARISGGLAVNDAVVRQQGNDRISIELPGLKDTKTALNLLGQTGQMYVIQTPQILPAGTDVSSQICASNCTSSQYKIFFRGQDLDTGAVSAGYDSNSGQPIVTFAFSDRDNARTRFGQYTASHLQQPLTIVLDNQVIESATIQSEIDGNGQITGIPTIQEAQSVASLLKYGALPLPLTVDSLNQLAPTLGQQALNNSKIAAAIGLGLVMLFMLIYYRLPGLLADVALLLYAGLIFASIKILGVTLSLPGIAATILTIGMAVDANVLIFERIKEELRGGRTMGAAIDIGFKRAWPSIRDSNASTLITCGILYFFGNNFGATLIVGFAINLAIGVALSLFTAVTVTRNLLNILLFTGVAQHPAWYGLPRNALPGFGTYRRPVSRVALAGAGGGGGTIVPARRAAAEDEDQEEEADLDAEADGLEPVGNARNGRAPSASRANTAGTTGGVEE
jgi:preprotein translocase subunit SecD